jgi:class 3 adenylate cyclase
MLDPPKHETTNYLILFADLVGSTEVATEVSPRFYARTYSASYRWAAHRALDYIKDPSAFPRQVFKKRIEEISVAGDEVLCFVPLCDLNEGEPQDIVASAVAFAWVTKLYWLACPYNVRRMVGKQFPRDIAVGLHIGPAALVPSEDNRSDIASLHINVAKRIEGQARRGTESRIFASYEVADNFKAWSEGAKAIPVADRSPLSFMRFSARKTPELKGVPKRVQLLELEWPDTDVHNLENLLGQLVETPDTDEVVSESAARFLAKTFLPVSDRPFAKASTSSPLVEMDIQSVTTGEGYIEEWFRGVAEWNKLFFDEPWLALNCYLVSCALLRHAAVNKSKRSEYIAIAKRLRDRFHELISLRDSRKPHTK